VLDQAAARLVELGGRGEIGKDPKVIGAS